ncbi:MAG TPA: hypothetical protein VM033_02965 [Gemmatimonadaceae bacterium]|nr:hypothetical protein [Gemmatimonadaceae bacterium]
MTSPMSSADDRDNALNPHRQEDVQHAADLVAESLRRRGVEVDGSEDSDQLASVLDAVETFERARSLRGADSFVNDPDSTQPDDRRFVIPTRNADEGLDDYAKRVRAAAAGIMTPAATDRPMADPGDLGADPDEEM